MFLNPSIVAENSQSLGDRLVDAALTSTVCLTSLRSKQETLHVFKGTTTIYHFRVFFARAAAKICRSGIRTKEKRTIEEGGVSLMPASSTVRLQGEEVCNRTIWVRRDFCGIYSSQ